MQSARDVPMRITSQSTSSERRITPSWTIRQLKQKLEQITGIESSCQKLTLHLPDQEGVVIEDADEDGKQVGAWQLVPYAEIKVLSTKSSNAAADPYWDPDLPKYVMPSEIYSALPATVLDYKRKNHIGRFDPAAAEIKERRFQEMWNEIHKREITLSSRCRISATRAGLVRYIGLVPELPDGPWIGVELDEPAGKNDGSVRGTRYFTCAPSAGVFLRAERVEVGDFGVLGVGVGEDDEVEDEDVDEDLEEI